MQNLIMEKSKHWMHIEHEEHSDAEELFECMGQCLGRLKPGRVRNVPYACKENLLHQK